MSVLLERGLHPERSSDVAMRTAGGLWFALNRTDPREIVAEARDRGIRALEVQHRDIGFLAELPDLEHLVLNTAEPDAEVINGLHRLRSLAFSFGWKGRLDFANLPALEWLYLTEADPDRGLETLLAGHTTIRQLAIGRYPATDLGALANLPSLERLDLFNARRFTSLAGADRVARSLRQLGLARLPRLPSLDGIAALPNLEYVAVESCSLITDLAPLRDLPRLRFLNLMQPKGVASLRPLAGHPSLEYVSFGRLADGDLTPLREMPRLERINTGSGRYNLDPREFPLLDDLSDDDPERVEYRSMAVG
jgi:Leucine-rich repeat (LRR) protein